MNEENIEGANQELKADRRWEKDRKGEVTNEWGYKWGWMTERAKYVWRKKESNEGDSDSDFM